MKLIRLIFVLLLSTNVALAASSPVPMLEKMANQVITALQQQKANLKSNPRVVYTIIDDILLPQIDVNGMSRSVLGRNIWNSLTASQKQRFNKEFTRLVVRTYAGALAEYTNEKVQFYPLRGNIAGQRRVQVNSRIIRRDGPQIRLSYRVILLGQQWKIYDMSVEGISLLQSFRTQFANELSQGSFNDLLKKLNAHNAKS